MSAARKGALACVVAAAANGAIVPECKDALDERLSGLGQIVDGDTVIDCQTLSSRGLCRFAGHLCDAACDRCGVPAHVRGGLTFVREDGSEEPLELLWYVDETIAAAAARLCVLIDSWGIRDAAPGFAALYRHLDGGGYSQALYGAPHKMPRCSQLRLIWLPLVNNATLNTIFLCRSDHTGVHLPVPERLLVMARGYQYKE